MNNNYFIKEGYIHKTVAPTAVAEGSQYWTDYRLDSSKYYQFHVYDFAKNLILNKTLTSCVDVGCGSGYKLAHIVAPVCKRCVGIDQPFIVKRCKEVYPAIEWISDDFENPHNVAGEKFDVIISADVIEHLLDPDILLNYLKSLSHPNSTVIISTPERDIMHGVSNIEAKNKEHIREWNQGEFKQYLESKGFIVDQIKLLPGLKFHLHRRYFSYLKHNYKKLNYNMMAVCRLR
jgi:2-polyprenyl-3-methyl-5-hydroxy-6-metoxy-1,4-benzoquinol methylase